MMVIFFMFIKIFIFKNKLLTILQNSISLNFKIYKSAVLILELCGNEY